MSAHFIIHLSQYIGKIMLANKVVLRDETEFEPGMLAIMIGVEQAQSDVFTLIMDTRPFFHHNESLLESNYYDKNGEPVLNAKEAGFWKDVSDYYVDPGFQLPFDCIGNTFETPVYNWSKPNNRKHIGLFSTEQEHLQHRLKPISPDFSKKFQDSYQSLTQKSIN